MCADVYGVVFEDPLPKMNGRRGQSQGGVDVFVQRKGVGRIGIQCKKYTFQAIGWDDVEDEVAKADKRLAPIKQLILATTAPSDARLLERVQLLSDARQAEGLFPVDIEFWDDICNHVERFTVLQDSYAPQSPGAAFHRHQEQLSTVHAVAVRSRATTRPTG